MKWFLKVMQNYATFSGRASRKEYWMFMLFWYIFYTLLLLSDGALGFEIVDGVPFNILSAIFAFATMIPSIAVGVRRLHDTGRSGWWMFISLIPVVGAIWLLVLFCLKGGVHENAYGAPSIQNN